jgi:hypothetical protein
MACLAAQTPLTQAAPSYSAAFCSFVCLASPTLRGTLPGNESVTKQQKKAKSQQETENGERLVQKSVLSVLRKPLEQRRRRCGRSTGMHGRLRASRALTNGLHGSAHRTFLALRIRFHQRGPLQMGPQGSLRWAEV